MDFSQVGALLDATTNVPTVGPTWATPAFLAALATLITSIGGVIAIVLNTRTTNQVQRTAVDTQAKVEDTHAQVHEVAVATNGAQDAMVRRLELLEAKLNPPPPSTSPQVTTAPPTTTWPVAETPTTGS